MSEIPDKILLRHGNLTIEKTKGKIRIGDKKGTILILGKSFLRRLAKKQKKEPKPQRDGKNSRRR